jgi:hypothetical protein
MRALKLRPNFRPFRHDRNAIRAHLLVRDNVPTLTSVQIVR